MEPLAAILSHGQPEFRIAGRRLQSASDSPDVCSLTYRALSEDAHPLGSAPPDYTNLRIVDREAQQDGSGYTIRVTAEGLKSGGWRVLGRSHSLPSAGWDATTLRVYTADPQNAKWVKGGQLEKAPLTVSAEADDELFTCVAHGLTSGMLGTLEFASGFTGAVSGTKYLIQKIAADQFRLANPAQTKYITGVHGTNVITSNAHGLADDTAVILPVLKGGAGLATFTIYYVRDAATNTFKLAATAGGAAIDFTTDITSYSTLVPLLTLSADGTGGTLRPVVKGMERMWITDVNCTAARGCEEAEALGLTGYYHLDLQFKGLDLCKGTGKLVDRRISATAQALSVEAFDPVVLAGNSIYYGDQDDDLQVVGTNTYTLGGRVDFDLPQAAVTLTYISTQPPPTWMLGSGLQWIPKDAPSVTTVGLYGTNDIMHFPSGWRLMNVQSEQIPGQSLYLTSVQIGNQRATTPGT